MMRALPLSLLAIGCAGTPSPAAPPAPARPVAPLQDAEPQASETDAAERERILAVLDRFFVAIAAKDKEAFAALLMPEGVALSQKVRPEGIELRIRTNAEVLERFGEGPRVVERYWDPKLLLRGPIAVVWAPYVLWADGKENHRGIDVFQLLLVNGEWRIATAMWTSETEAQDELVPPDASLLRPAITP